MPATPVSAHIDCTVNKLGENAPVYKDRSAFYALWKHAGMANHVQSFVSVTTQ